MFFDILAIFIVTLLSSLFLSTTSIYGLPSSASTLQYIANSPSADLSSSLRLIKHRPVTSVDNDSGGDISEMFIDEKNQPQRKRLAPTTRFHVNSAVATLAESPSSNADYDQFQEPIRLSPSLKKLVETNPFARAWLTMLLQKLMQEQPVPYIFKYGRRRK
ncbi:hypothetical protein I4U23_012793 [Adineta vaga]|nr:hypothetical protein I4U23_012793 [Adineta vaga]